MLLAVDNLKQCPSQVGQKHQHDECMYTFDAKLTQNFKNTQKARWAAITSVDIITELATWLLIVQLTWNVNMSVSRKCQVAMAFSFRLPLIALSAVHLAYFLQYPGAAEPQFAITNSLLVQQAMISWSLMSATVPNLKNFLKSFSIGMGFPLAFDITMSGSGGAYVLRSFPNNSRSRKGTASAAAGTGAVSTSVSANGRSDGELQSQPRNWRADGASNTATGTHPYSNSSRENVTEEENSRSGSQDMIINKEIAWKITYEDRI